MRYTLTEWRKPWGRAYTLELSVPNDEPVLLDFSSRAAAVQFAELLERYGVHPRSGAADEAWVLAAYGDIAGAAAELRKNVEAGRWLQPL